MPNILSLEASTAVCSVALCNQSGSEKKTLDLFESTPKSHTQKILPMVDALLTEQNLSVNELDAIAFACGPGSFTGLRIATSVAQGLAFAANLPVIGVSTLKAMAWGAKQEGLIKAGQTCVICLDAKMDELYLAAWKLESEHLIPVVDEVLIKPDAAVEAIASLNLDEMIILGDGADLLPIESADLIEKIISRDATCIPHAKYVSDLAILAWDNNEVQSPEQAEPTYLRGKNAWKTVAEQGKP